jgi:hypothetical protein
MNESAPNNGSRKSKIKAMLAALGIGALSLAPSGEKQNTDYETHSDVQGTEHVEQDFDLETEILHEETEVQAITTHPKKPGFKTLEFNIAGNIEEVEMVEDEANDVIASGRVDIAYVKNDDGSIQIIGITPPGESRQLVKKLLKQIGSQGYFRQVGGEESIKDNTPNSPGYYRKI